MKQRLIILEQSLIRINRGWERYFLSKIDKGFARNRFAIVEVSSFSFDSLILLRWHWWAKLVGKEFKTEFTYMTKKYLERATFNELVNSFVGNTYMNQAEKNCPDGKLPVVSVHTTGRRYEQDVVLVRSVYWGSLLEKILDKTV